MSVLSKAALNAQADTNFSTNGVKANTGALTRTTVKNIIDSYQDAIPQLTTIQIAALTPTLNQLVYNTDRNYLMQYNGSIWVYLVAMFIGTTSEVNAAANKAGQIYFDTDTNSYNLGSASGKVPIVTGDCVCPKRYLALIEQTGTDAPTATVIVNTTGATVVFTYVGIGSYRATFSSAVLTANKTVARFQCVRDENNFGGLYGVTTTYVDFFTVDGAVANDDGLIGTGSTIEVLIYP